MPKTVLSWSGHDRYRTQAHAATNSGTRTAVYVQQTTKSPKLQIAYLDYPLFNDFLGDSLSWGYLKTGHQNLGLTDTP